MLQVISLALNATSGIHAHALLEVVKKHAAWNLSKPISQFKQYHINILKKLNRNTGCVSINSTNNLLWVTTHTNKAGIINNHKLTQRLCTLLSDWVFNSSVLAVVCNQQCYRCIGNFQIVLYKNKSNRQELQKMQ